MDYVFKCTEKLEGYFKSCPSLCACRSARGVVDRATCVNHLLFRTRQRSLKRESTTGVLSLNSSAHFIRLQQKGSGRVNLVPLPSVVTSPRDVALAAVICSALATVLLALLVLCVIYCKRQLLEKKPSASSLRSQDCPYSGAELSCMDARWLHDFPHRTCCQCHLDSGHHCGPVHLNPSLCCDESCSLGRSQNVSPFQSQMSLSDENRRLHEEDTPMWLEGHTEPECVGEDEMTGSVGSPEYLELPLCGVDPAGGSEEGGEEREGLREYSCERRREDCSDTVTDALLPKQQGQTQEALCPG
ncbi:tumor necrosis factor receptor superfamily member 19-like isoform X3 [Gambusia affinis]|uniref:tumor necrosis factor receptor superfamily member 19-like isoform X3 n=1 Tax=Gambusia affinis TaxID=33528 RepID=UPI001CDCF21F|nr:tumor necrosis factor receptor superfamily member 19-like isoform X3 [Gambusia affinis]